MIPLELGFDEKNEMLEHVSSGALIAIISRICACPSRKASASLRSVMSREMPATPKISLRSLRSGTFVVRIQVLAPEASDMRRNPSAARRWQVAALNGPAIPQLSV
jgi:hypothetical protein